MTATHRKNDRDTSVEAGVALLDHRTRLQEAVLGFAKRRPKGFTDVELNQCFNATGSTYRTRRSELTEMGLIVDTGRRKTHLPSPRKHIVWAIKSALDVKY